MGREQPPPVRAANARGGGLTDQPTRHTASRANPPAETLAAPCRCKFCRRADEHHEEYDRQTRRSIEAQQCGDYETARDADTLRAQWLDAAARCIAHCETTAPTPTPPSLAEAGQALYDALAALDGWHAALAAYERQAGEGLHGAACEAADWLDTLANSDAPRSVKADARAIVDQIDTALSADEERREADGRLRAAALAVALRFPLVGEGAQSVTLTPKECNDLTEALGSDYVAALARRRER